MAASINDPAFWRDRAYEREATGDYPGAVEDWRAAIAAAERQGNAAEALLELVWLKQRLAAAQAVARPARRKFTN